MEDTVQIDPPSADEIVKINADLFIAKKSRTSAKGWVTRILQKLDAISGKDETDEDDVANLKQHMLELQPRLDRAREKNEEMLELYYAARASERTINHVNEWGYTLEDDVHTSLVAAKEAIRRAELHFEERRQAQADDARIATAAAIAAAAGDDPAGPAPPAPAPIEVVRTKNAFQQLAPEPFDPEKDDWPRFLARWQLYIGTRDDVQPMSKLAVLTSKVKGAAHQAIRRFAITNENYDKAMDLLTQRYGDIELLANKYIAAHNNAKPVAVMNAAKLQELADVLTTNAENLEGLGRPIDPTTTISIWISKFPAAINHQMSRYMVDNDIKKWKVDEFLEFIDDEIQIQRRFEATQGAGPQKQVQQDKAVIAAAQGKPGDKKQNDKNKSKPAKKKDDGDWFRCIACKSKDHFATDCPTFIKMSIADRYKLVKDMEACICCLKKNHSAKDCRTKGDNKCKKCEQVHNTLLHMPAKVATAQTNATTTVKTD